MESRAGFFTDTKHRHMKKLYFTALLVLPQPLLGVFVGYKEMVLAALLALARLLHTQTAQ